MIFDRPGPRWYSIDAHRPFLVDLARVLFDTLGRDDPARLSEAVVLVPTRRAIRALAEAFVGAADGKAVLLPQIRALGDLEEGEPPFEPGDLALDLPPAVTPMRRRFELARLVLDNAKDFAPTLGGLGALQLADALADFLDAAAIEEAKPPKDPATLLQGEFAEHWKVSAAALRVATELWPARLHQLGLIDVAERRTELLRVLTAQWRINPPERPLIAAGSTGSAPATARLLKVIAEAPKGAVVLPGLDRDLADSAWAEVADDHPQGALRRLLEIAKLTRGEVASWPAVETPAEAARGRDRRRVINEALRPAEATKDWRVQIEALRKEAGEGPDPVAEGLKGLSLVEAHAEEEAAAAIALLMREALEMPGRTCALVTPDQALARRVSARLARWRIEADSSSGRPLSQTPIGQLIGLVARSGGAGFDPPTLLALLKHPLATLAEDDSLRTLERRGLRGVRPRGWPGLRARLVKARDNHPEADPALYDAALVLAEALEAALSPLTDLFADGPADPPAAAEALARAIEALAPAAWGGQTGEVASGLIASLMEDGAALPPLTGGAFAELVRELTDGQMVRPGGALHPRLSILGAIEARLVRPDLLILAGLEEGVWPRLPPIDPFFARPMRRTIGLPPPERRIGLSAHDFAQGASAPEVVLVTTERRGGQPAVRSRWLWRLQTLARGAGVDLPRRDDILALARRLDAPLEPAPPELKAAARPAPKPPYDARPRELPVTSIERWVRDPYSIYARNILGLRSLDPPDTPMDARARGTAIHSVFQRFAEAHEAGSAPDAEQFVTLMLAALQAEGAPDAALAREGALARRLAAWVVNEFEPGRRPPGRRFLIEQQGVLKFPVDGGAFTVTAKADRIELDDGIGHVLDFKTGAAASKKQMDAGLSPQLTLTAAILMHGGFEGAGPVEPGELLYVRVTGRRIPGQVLNPLKSVATQAEAERALEGLIGRVRRFDDPTHPYRSWTAPQFLTDRGGGAYDHLARVFEWHVSGADGGEGE